MGCTESVSRDTKSVIRLKNITKSQDFVNKSHISTKNPNTQLSSKSYHIFDFDPKTKEKNEKEKEPSPKEAASSPSKRQDVSKDRSTNLGKFEQHCQAIENLRLTPTHSFARTPSCKKKYEINKYVFPNKSIFVNSEKLQISEKNQRKFINLLEIPPPSKSTPPFKRNFMPPNVQSSGFPQATKKVSPARVSSNFKVKEACRPQFVRQAQAKPAAELANSDSAHQGEEPQTAQFKGLKMQKLSSPQILEPSAMRSYVPILEANPPRRLKRMKRAPSKTIMASSPSINRINLLSESKSVFRKGFELDVSSKPSLSYLKKNQDKQGFKIGTPVVRSTLWKSGKLYSTPKSRISGSSKALKDPRFKNMAFGALLHSSPLQVETKPKREASNSSLQGVSLSFFLQPKGEKPPQPSVSEVVPSCMLDDSGLSNFQTNKFPIEDSEQD